MQFNIVQLHLSIKYTLIKKCHIYKFTLQLMSNCNIYLKNYIFIIFFFYSFMKDKRELSNWNWFIWHLIFSITYCSFYEMLSFNKGQHLKIRGSNFLNDFETNESDPKSNYLWLRWIQIEQFCSLNDKLRYAPKSDNVMCCIAWENLIA